MIALIPTSFASDSGDQSNKQLHLSEGFFGMPSLQAKAVALCSPCNRMNIGISISLTLTSPAPSFICVRSWTAVPVLCSIGDCVAR